jgi:hypothetical protein
MTDNEQQAAKPSQRKGFGVNFKVSAKGAVSVYGLGRFPVTLYREQWVRLLERADDLKAFMEEHAGELAKKGEAPAAAEAPATAEAPAAEVPAQAPESAPQATTVDDAAGSDEPGDPDMPPDDYDGLS